MKKSILCLIFSFLITPWLYAQQENANYEPDLIVVKLKSENVPSSNQRLSASADASSDIESVLKGLSVKDFRRVFSEKESQGKRQSAQVVDLSKVYFVQIKPGQNLEEAIEALSKNEAIEYAERYYNHKLLLVPNDPNANPTNGIQYQLGLIKAYEAWDVQRGDSNIVIGIIDTGVLTTHQDLFKNLKKNWNDQVNGVDDDNDGYIDNFTGWDFATGDNDVTADYNGHGTEVAGCSNGEANNKIGIAGTSFNSKFLPLKCFRSSDGKFFGGFEAIKYAADKGCKVINLSWGNEGGYSKFEQDIINYAVLDKDVVVVAAAGNTPKNIKFYPASYENVLSVGATNSQDLKADFSTFNHWIDLSAPGQAVGTTLNVDNTYGKANGTSYAAPVVAGAAALVRARFPKYNAFQVMEQLRVTSDNIFASTSYHELMGKGRLNMQRALTDTTSPAVRVQSFTYSNSFGNFAFYEDTIRLKVNLKNYLEATNNLKVTLSSTSPYVTILKGELNLGKINKLQSKDNHDSPFEFYLSPETPDSQSIVLRVGFEDGIYRDYEYIEIFTSPDYIDVPFNSIMLTTTSKGRLGFKNDSKTLGVGLLNNSQQILGSGGVMFATSESKVSNNVITNLATGFTDQNLTSTRNVKYFTGTHADTETRGTLVDDINNPEKIGLLITHKAYGWKELKSANHVILEYHVTNISGNNIPMLYTGIFADWNINYLDKNKADWDAEDNFGYVYSSTEGDDMVALGLLTSGAPVYYPLERSSDNGNGIVLSDGFTKVEKFRTLSNGLARTKAGGEEGMDVSQVVGAKLENLENKKSAKIAYAIVVGKNLQELKDGIRKARENFEQYQLNPHTTLSINYCYNSPAIIKRPSDKAFHLYDNLPATTPFFSGTSFQTLPLTENKTYYITNDDEGFESEPTRVAVLNNDISADFNMSSDTIDLNITNKVTFSDQSKGAIAWKWDFNNGYKSSTASTVRTFSKQGEYNITLIVENATGCKDTISKKLVVISTSPKPVVSQMSVCKGESVVIEPSNGTKFKFYESYPLINATLTGKTFVVNNLQQSKTIWITNIDSLFESSPLEYEIKVWDKFADFKISTDTIDLDQNPSAVFTDLGTNSIYWKWIKGQEVIEGANKATFSFSKVGKYEISLVVRNIAGCVDTITKSVVVVRKSPKPVHKNITVCENTSVQIGFETGKIYNFYQQYPGTPVFTGSSYLTNPITSATTFFVTNIDSLKESEPIVVNIQVLDIIADFLSTTDTLNLNEGNTIEFSSLSAEAVKWHWDFGNGKSDSVKSPIAVFEKAGRYKVSLTTENGVGCRDSSFRDIIVTSDDYILDDVLHLYPNPAKKTIKIVSEMPEEDLLEIQLINNQGKVVQRLLNQNIGREIIEIDVTECYSGLYFLIIKGKNGSVVKRVIISN